MTDKVQKIREEVARIQLYTQSEVLKQILDFIDSLQKEPVSKDFEMALAEMIDKAQKCVVEPLVVAEQWKDELIKLAKSKEPVSKIDFEQELYKAFGQIKDFTLGIAIAKRFYDMGRKHNEPVNEELEEAASSFARKDSEGISNPADFYYTVADKARIFKAGAEWQKQKDSIPISKELEDFAKRQADEFAEREYEVDSYDRDYLSKGYYWGCKDGAKWQIAKLMANATEVTVHIDAGGYPYIPQMELYDYDKDIPLAKEGDKYKVVLIKED